MATIGMMKRRLSDTTDEEPQILKKPRCDTVDLGEDCKFLNDSSTNACQQKPGDISLNKTNISSPDEHQKENVNGTEETIDLRKDEENKTEPRVEARKFPKLYRLLHEQDDITQGLKAKNPNAKKSVADHVATGSGRGYRSQFISTCESLSKAECFRGLKLVSGYKYGMKHIAEIHVGMLPENVQIIDLRTVSMRREYETGNDEIDKKFHKFAESHQEVLLEGHVPAHCLKLIEFTGTVPVTDSSSDDSNGTFDFSFDCDSEYESDNW